MLPHFFEAEISSISYFTFLLPAAEALGLNSDKILKISVDYGLAPDGKQIAANAWAREQSGVIKGFIYSPNSALRSCVKYLYGTLEENINNGYHFKNR